MNSWVVIVTFGALIFYIATGIRIGRARGRYHVTAPAMTGPSEFERLVRVQANTLEWLVVFLPCLWLCASYADSRAAAFLGAVWIVGRVLYARAYEHNPPSRLLGFRIQAGATLLLALGGLGGAVAILVRHGG